MTGQKKKIIIILSVCLVVFTAALSVGLWAIFGRGMSKDKIVVKVFANASDTIQKQNKAFAESFNNLNEQSATQTVSQYSAVPFAREGDVLDGSDTMEEFIELQNLYMASFTYFEYVCENSNVKDILDKTVKIDQDNMQLYVGYKVELFVKMMFDPKQDYIELLFLEREIETQDIVHDYISSRLYFDENYNATRLVIFDKFLSSDSSETYSYTREIEFDLVSHTVEMTEIAFGGDDSAATVTALDDNAIFGRVKDFAYYFVSFDDASRYVGLRTRGSFHYLSQANISSQNRAKILGYIRAATFQNFDNFEANFDLANMTVYQNGNEAVTYSLNKYKMELNKFEGVNGNQYYYITFRQINGIKQEILDVFDLVGEAMGDESFVPAEFANYSYNYTPAEGASVNIKRKLVSDGTFATADIDTLGNWILNQYNSNTYYFKPVQIGTWTMTLEGDQMVLERASENLLEWVVVYARTSKFSKESCIAYFKVIGQQQLEYFEFVNSEQYTLGNSGNVYLTRKSDYSFYGKTTFEQGTLASVLAQGQVSFNEAHYTGYDAKYSAKGDFEYKERRNNGVVSGSQYFALDFENGKQKLYESDRTLNKVTGTVDYNTFSNEVTLHEQNEQSYNYYLFSSIDFLFFLR